MWRQVICGKYREEEGEWRSYEVRGSFGVGLWKAIRREWDVMGNNMVFSVGNGRRVRFWKDKWCGDDSLCIVFPSLFAITLSKEAWVKDVWSHSGGGVWDPYFSKRLNHWEVSDVERFLQRLQRRRVYSDVEDHLYGQSQRTIFLMSSLYIRLWNR